MMHVTKLSIVGFILASGAAACTGSPEDIEPFEETASAALTKPRNFTYFTMRADARRCAAPLCGGYFVKAVNVASTRCADGTSQPECYVADLDLSALGLSATQQTYLRGHSREFLLRGAVVQQGSLPSGKLAAFAATEAWRGHENSSPSGAFVRAKATGTVCITFPCPILSAALLNTSKEPLSVAELDLAAVSPDTSDGLAQLEEPEGLLVAATRTVVTGPAGDGVGLEATEYYVPFEPRPTLCGSRGLPECDAGEYCAFAPEANCGRADAPGVCTPKPVTCTEQYEPVCGCDGQTYGNACAAAVAGVSAEFRGECVAEPRVCGTILGLGCEDGQYCDFGMGQCLVSDAAGACRAQPEMCPQLHAPVCGCDGKTYGNACSAAAAGAQIDHEGRCR